MDEWQEWEAGGVSTVPDLTPNWLPKGRRSCPSSHSRWGYFCTRLEDHTGRHAAGTGFHIVAVWRS